MPQKSKGYSKFKKTYKRAGKFMKYAGNAIQVASKAYSIAKTVASLVNAELKTYQVVPTTATITSTPVIYNLCTPTRGTGSSERVGDSIMLKSCLVKTDLLWNTSGIGDQTLRMILLCDMNTNTTGDWNTPQDLLQSAGNPISLRNANNRKRFKVLSDTVVYRDSSVNRIENRNFYTKGLYKRDKRGAPILHHITYQGALSYGKNHLYLMVFSNVATNAPTLGITWECRFYDN